MRGPGARRGWPPRPLGLRGEGASAPVVIAPAASSLGLRDTAPRLGASCVPGRVLGTVPSLSPFGPPQPREVGVAARCTGTDAEARGRAGARPRAVCDTVGSGPRGFCGPGPTQAGMSAAATAAPVTEGACPAYPRRASGAHFLT